jgi:predicted transposase YbfD/YdcC
MQYTASPGGLTALHDRPLTPALLAALEPAVPVALPAGGRPVPLCCLPTLFATIPDPRRAQGRRFALPALLAATLAALLCNHLSQLAVAEWLADAPPAVQRALGFRPGHTPHQSTFNRVLRRIEPTYLATALHQFLDLPATDDRPRGSQGISLDGKAQRGRLRFTPPAPGICPVHEVSAFAAELGVVLAAAPIRSQEDKAAAELNTAPRVIAQLDWHGRVLTGDALLCQRSICQQVVAAGGDYLFTVKANQPHLLDYIQRLFAPERPRRYGYAPLPWEHRETATREQGHGRLEIRYLQASTELAGLVDWPHLAQVFLVIRSWEAKGQVHQEVHWGVTSLPAGVADVERLLEVRRGHWRIENSLHYVKDVTLGEDKSLTHAGQGPAIMSLLRDMVVSLLHDAGYWQVAARLRYLSRHPLAALTLLGRAVAQNA